MQKGCYRKVVAGKCYVGHSACEEDAKILVTLIEEKVPTLKDKVVLGDIGTVIGSYTGPGTLVVCFWVTKVHKEKTSRKTQFFVVCRKPRVRRVVLRSLWR